MTNDHMNGDSISDAENERQVQELRDRINRSTEFNDVLGLGETVTTDSPKVDLGHAKSIVAAIGGAVLGGLTALSTALVDNDVSSMEWTIIAIATITGAGIVGGGTWAVPTTVTRMR